MSTEPDNTMRAIAEIVGAGHGYRAEADAVAALTAAARRTRTVGAGTPNEHTTRTDFAEIACRVLTTVAANLGGVEALLAGRPGSWEADYVRQIVHATAGADLWDLARWRSEPVPFGFDPEVDFDEYGITDMYDEDRDAAAAQTWDESNTAVASAAEDLVDAIEQLEDSDLAAYRAAYVAAAEGLLTEHGIDVGVMAIDPADVDPNDWVGEELHRHARATTPLPMSGRPADWSDGTPADALRRAGLTYTARARHADQ